MLRQANFCSPNDTFCIFKNLHTCPTQSTTLKLSIKERIQTLLYTGRVLDIESTEEAKLGKVVTVMIKRSKAELSIEQISNWLIKLGKIILEPRYFNLDQTLVINSQLAITHHCNFYTAVVHYYRIKLYLLISKKVGLAKKREGSLLAHSLLLMFQSLLAILKRMVYSQLA